ncbi:MAG: hypothetical protein K9N46_01030 [Candidatus Marinimicrobia bacterium]|nr:hypothetical protein [Candidatus Neomarinimicrobiota bacterium]MCF7827940.1 hypothetical protein [Candidatus Neomarinimicrobiota bacterium]MCF7879305.1 hypothetical protein [Candidatus Neomarinimicrobiota bacterium]
MQLKANYTWFVRIGLILIGAAGFIFAIGDSLIPQEFAMFSSTEDPQGFAELVTMDGFRLWAMRGYIGAPLETIGTIALFFGLIGSPKETLAFWGMLLALLGDLVGTGMFMIMTYVFPDVGHLILEGNTAAASVASLEGFMPVMGILFLATTVALIFFAIAIWQSDRFPRWSGIVVVVGFLALLIQTSYVVQILGNVVWGTGYLWMAVYSWNRLPFTESDIHAADPV